jgi:hypothetical protein
LLRVEAARAKKLARKLKREESLMIVQTSLAKTGKFKNIKGSGTYRGKATAEGASTEFEGEVEY